VSRPALVWQDNTQVGHLVAEIRREGAECIAELRPLWLALRDHHRAVAPQLGPVWNDEESWGRRRAHHERALAGAGAFVLVAREAGRAVGYALVTLRGASYTWRYPAAHGELEAISVLPEAQGDGIGRALVERCYAELAERGIDTMTLRVIEGNAQARGFYERMGFAPWVVELRGRRVSVELRGSGGSPSVTSTGETTVSPPITGTGENEVSPSITGTGDLRRRYGCGPQET
jgi:ribosomal protein S18 acetylase RimI-like enzyme